MILGSNINRLINKLDCWGAGVGASPGLGGPGLGDGNGGPAGGDGPGGEGSVDGGGMFGGISGFGSYGDPAGGLMSHSSLASNIPDFASDFSGLPDSSFFGSLAMGPVIGRGMAHGSLSPAEAFGMIGEQGYGPLGNIAATVGALSSSVPGSLSGALGLAGMPLGLGMVANAALSSLTGQNPFGAPSNDAPNTSGPLDNLKNNTQGLMADVKMIPQQTKSKLNINNVLNSPAPYLQALDFLTLSGIL